MSLKVANRIVSEVLKQARSGFFKEASVSAPGVDSHETSVAELAELIKSEVGDAPDEKFVEYTPDSDYVETGLMGGVQILWMNGLYELSAAEFEDLKSLLPDFDFQVEQDSDYFGDGNEPATEAVQVGRGSTQTISVDELARQIADSGQQQLEHSEIGGQYAVYAPDGRYVLSVEEFRRLQELLDGVQFNSVDQQVHEAAGADHAQIAKILKDAGLYVVYHGEGQGGEEHMYSVYPRRNWEKVVEDGLIDWQELASDSGNTLERLLNDYGFEVGDSGGGNFSMVDNLKEPKIRFAFWGNPHHI